jgi:4-aminobutyrate aminotransferase / (S)-3-amino-2-methylpropionate transaminase / 5-aminovalerate transaminase
MTSNKTQYFNELRQEHVARGPANMTPAVIAKASGATMTDVDGKVFIDFAGGIGVNNVGHAHPKVVKAIKDQADQFIHTCFHVGMYESYIELARQLNTLVPGYFPKKTMFANSGAEAVENAVKVARYATKRPAVIAFENGFHGRTLMTMTLTSKIKPYKYGFGPFAPEVYRLPFAYCYRCPVGCTYPSCDTACADLLESSFITHVDPESCAAIIAEPIQGEGGFITPPPEYFPKLAAIAKKYGILLIMDEVQSGAGRTGKFLASEHWGITPDIVTQAKSLAGGMPLSAVTGRAELMDAPHAGGLGGTYSGNPLSCKAALAVLEILLKDNLLERSRELGEILQKRFADLADRHEIIGEVRGKGPMLALELVKDRKTKEPAAEETRKLIQTCYDKGLVLLSCGNFGNVIRTLMPFVITDEQLDKSLSILEDGFKAVKEKT